MTTQAAADVLAERQRQVSAEGWTLANDDQHSSGELAQAAACYILNAQGMAIRCGDSTLWPKSWDESWWRPKDRRRDLVRAAALILAEIERMDRAAAASQHLAEATLSDGAPARETIDSITSYYRDKAASGSPPPFQR